MKKIVIYMLLVLFALSFNSCSTGKEQVVTGTSIKTSTDYYNIAMENSRKFESSNFKNMLAYEKAVTNFQEVLFVEKLNSDAWYNLGRVLFYGGDYQRAKEAFKNAIRYRKNFVESYSMLAKTLMVEGKMDEAIAVAEKAYENVPDNEIAMNGLAVAYIHVKRYDEARSICENIIKNNTKFTPAYITLGDIYYIQKKYELARLIYLKALDQGDDSGELYTNMGLVTMHTEQDKGTALNYFRKGAERSPADPYTHLNLGNFFMSSGDYEGAISEFETALKLSPMMVEAMVGQGSAYMQLKLLDKAENLYKKAIETDPGCAEAYFNYGLLVADYRDNRTEALNLFNKFLELKGAEISKDHRVYKYIDEMKSERTRSNKTGKKV